MGLIHEFLSSSSYWAKGRSRAVVERSIAHSICFGAYRHQRQVGFARVVTDHAVFAYLMDVFVLPDHRGRGVGKALMNAVVGHSDLQGLRLFALRTRDAHGLYAQFGFGPLTEPAYAKRLTDTSDSSHTESRLGLAHAAHRFARCGHVRVLKRAKWPCIQTPWPQARGKVRRPQPADSGTPG